MRILVNIVVGLFVIFLFLVGIALCTMSAQLPRARSVSSAER